jgi:hypothetical protein
MSEPKMRLSVKVRILLNISLPKKIGAYPKEGIEINKSMSMNEKKNEI